MPSKFTGLDIADLGVCFCSSVGLECELGQLDGSLLTACGPLKVFLAEDFGTVGSKLLVK